MVLSPVDIHNKEFSTKLRGYNIDEVNDFLEQIIKDYQITLDENKKLTEQLATSDEKLKYFTELKDSLNQSIIVAQEAADKVKNNSQREAEIINQEAQKQATDIVNAANEKADQLVNGAVEQAKRLAIETDDLKKGVRVFRQRLEVMLDTQLEVVKGGDWDDLLTQDSSFDELKRAIEQSELDNANGQEVNSNSQAPVSENQSAADQAPEEIEETEQTVNSQSPENVETVVVFPDDADDTYK
ncbi:DivIVA domain-containing protein [Secundilactobacillus kimchicus]|uniref:Cell division initiation protein diviva n=1 Tax=Secundilactobacillus kimchicus JCM 15530 TaxID=1302272 RepID=A0A0R1HY78_9LACO|nr:DivIVA domain-containing protein [Secundilactobacillus kimchicus]KRK49539.1 cell division initiation protein diviva [Secundilactobacillus kimchicus JCM 15530]MBT9673083.1 DivIVA domain-containing protein [Secundilactobacillus kimchicus]